MKITFETNINSAQIIQSIDKIEKQFDEKERNYLSNNILDDVLKDVQPVNFRKYVKFDNEKRQLQKKHYLVSIIEILTQKIKKLNYDIGVKNNIIYLYNGRYWEQIEEGQIKSFLGMVALKMNVNKYDAKLHTFKDELYKQFLTETSLSHKIKTTEKSTLINLKNGTFEISSEKQILREFRKEDFLTYQLDFEYKENAETPLFNAFIDKVLPDKKLQNILAEYLGYIFIPNSTLKFEKVLLLYGTGANGKSVLFNIINAVFGKENVSNYTLESITNNNGYERAMLGNKLLNYASEINGKMETHFFKLLISGEPVQVRLPYGKPYILTDYAKFIFNTNELPREVENTHAFFRRFIIIPFKVTIPEKEQDINLSQKIIKNELPGIFNWILKGLKRLLKNKQFITSEIVEKEINTYKKESDSVLMFLEDEKYTISTTSHTYLKEIYMHYKLYCLDNGYRQLSIRNFSKRLVNAGYVKERKSNGIVIYIKKE